jgi:hypothetical protein
MSTRSSVILGVSLIVCCLILGTSFGPPSFAQQDKKTQVQGTQTAVGRYQEFVQVDRNRFPMIYLVDTATGQMWSKAGGKWIDEETPPSKK